tara:strand:+ start:9287 stop:10456 length:1170 start_codon:yes stop_codon:yes gene_type:complete
MMENSILIEGLSKEYSISKGKEKFWALKDINLEIKEGKVMGLIGPNGAGKSTLLKILGKITYPTKGRALLNGSLASLLEVGTGFHPELTGRENIFLNGSILGMSKSDIIKEMDEIVDFSGVGKFLDSPVKHYSSGMYVRLAFSVAAHLRSDILLIDEVLAVGDAQFQKKCLAKMSSTTRDENRTVVFVSHNMSIARKLCDEIAYIEQGQLKMLGDSEKVTDHYLKTLQKNSEEKALKDRLDRSGTGDVKFVDIDFFDPKTHRSKTLICGEAAEFMVKYESRNNDKIGELVLHLNVFNDDGNYLASFSNELVNMPFKNLEANGSLHCKIEKLPLMPGHYFLKARLFVNGQKSDIIDRAINFEVLEGDFFGSGSFYKKRIPGIFVEQRWSH